MRIAVAGAADDTANLGVTALLHSTLHGLSRRLPDAEFVVLDHGRGVRRGAIPLAGRTIEVRRAGVVWSRRWYRQECLRQIRLIASAPFASIGTPVLNTLRSCSLVLDVSGGDSFSDIYGQPRFDAISSVKEVVQQLRIPLVLLPQTYGPYADDQNLTRARRSVSYASRAFARDADSLAVLCGMADAAACRASVDLAFALPTERPTHVPEELLAWHGRPGTVGINASGLLASRAAVDGTSEMIDHESFVAELIGQLLARSRDVRVLLVPHVLGTTESDVVVSDRLARRFDPDRVKMIPPTLDPKETKWWINGCEWFAGARMHATIAALSSGVPAAGFAYSGKFKGVFASVGLEGNALDLPRVRDVSTGVASVMEMFERRDTDRQTLALRLPSAASVIEATFDEIASFAQRGGR